MATTVRRISTEAAHQTAIRPFRVNVPETELAGLRGRIQATRWPERETVTDATQGVHFAAWEQPKLFTEELRSGFRSLRSE